MLDVLTPKLVTRQACLLSPLWAIVLEVLASTIGEEKEIQIKGEQQNSLLTDNIADCTEYAKNLQSSYEEK